MFISSNKGSSFQDSTQGERGKETSADDFKASAVSITKQTKAIFPRPPMVVGSSPFVPMFEKFSFD